MKPRRLARILGTIVVVCATAALLWQRFGPIPLLGDTGILAPGPTTGKTVYLAKGRGYAFCEFEVVTGGLLDGLYVQVYNTSGQEQCSPEKFNPIDAKALARKLGVDAVVKNPRRWWLVDQLWSYDAGQTFDFDGIKATWMAQLKLNAGDIEQHGKPFPSYREGAVTRHSKYTWAKGSTVYLLRSPDKHTWVMQAYTDLVDKSLTEAGLAKLGSRLKLPPGWQFEVKTLERELTLAPPASTGYLAHAVSDELQNIYAGCGFDDACNYMP